MAIYRVVLEYTNLDNSLYTDEQASISFEIKADDVNHAYLLAELLKNKLDADHYKVD